MISKRSIPALCIGLPKNANQILNDVTLLTSTKQNIKIEQLNKTKHRERSLHILSTVTCRRVIHYLKKKEDRNYMSSRRPFVFGGFMTWLMLWGRGLHFTAI